MYSCLVLHSSKFIPIEIGISSWIPNLGWNSKLNTDSNWISKLNSWSVGRVYLLFTTIHRRDGHPQRLSSDSLSAYDRQLTRKLKRWAFSSDQRLHVHKGNWERFVKYLSLKCLVINPFKRDVLQRWLRGKSIHLILCICMSLSLLWATLLKVISLMQRSICV